MSSLEFCEEVLEIKLLPHQKKLLSLLDKADCSYHPVCRWQGRYEAELAFVECMKAIYSKKDNKTKIC